MSELSTTIVEGYHYTGDGLDLSGTDFWGLALDQRAFGPSKGGPLPALRTTAAWGSSRLAAAAPYPVRPGLAPAWSQPGPGVAPAWPTARVPNSPSWPSSAA